MVLLHTGVLIGAAVEVVFLHRPFYPVLAAICFVIFLAANVVRWWVIRTLGEHWNVQVDELHRPGRRHVRSVPLCSPPQLRRRLCGNAGPSADSFRLDHRRWPVRSPIFWCFPSASPPKSACSSPMRSTAPPCRQASFFAGIVLRGFDDAPPLRTLAAAGSRLLFCCSCFYLNAASAPHRYVRRLLPFPNSKMAFTILYKQKFPEAREVFEKWADDNPDEPFGQVAIAASYLFEEFYPSARSHQRLFPE